MSTTHLNSTPPVTSQALRYPKWHLPNPRTMLYNKSDGNKPHRPNILTWCSRSVLLLHSGRCRGCRRPCRRATKGESWWSGCWERMSSWEAKSTLTTYSMYRLVSLHLCSRLHLYYQRAHPQLQHFRLHLGREDKNSALPGAVVDAALSPVAAGPPRVKPGWLAGGVVRVLVPRDLNALPPA